MTYADILKFRFPEGSYGGQCGTFAHRIINFPPVGDLLAQKIASVNKFGIPNSQPITYQLGDVVIENYQPYGHVCVVNDVNGQILTLTESNFNYITKPLKVSHKRQINILDLHIVGIIRGTMI